MRGRVRGLAVGAALPFALTFDETAAGSKCWEDELCNNPTPSAADAITKEKCQPKDQDDNTPEFRTRAAKTLASAVETLDSPSAALS